VIIDEEDIEGHTLYLSPNSLQRRL